MNESPTNATHQSPPTPARAAGFPNARIVSREEWLQARLALLVREKELTRRSDALAAERRQLPWVRMETPYVFATAAGPASLGDLFAGRSQLAIYHFMYGPDWDEGCPSCSMVADHLNP